MQPITSSDHFLEVLSSFKREGFVQHASGILTPLELDKNAREGRMFYVSASDFLILLLDQGDFFRSYCFLYREEGASADDALAREEETSSLRDALANVGKPVVVEFSYRSCMPVKLCGIVSFVERIGFAPYRRNARLQLDLANLPEDGEAALSDELTLRPAAAADLEEVSSLWQSRLDRYQSFVLSGEEMLASADSGCIMLVSDGPRICGAALRRDKGATTTLGPVAVDPGYRRKGIASALYQESLRLANEAGCFRSLVWVDQENELGMKFHETFGYKPDGSIIESYIFLSLGK